MDLLNKTQEINQMSLFGKGYSDKAQKPTDFQKRTLDTDVYPGIIKMAFVGQSAGGAANVTLEVKLDNGKTYKETIYVTNRQGSNTYEKDGKEFYLPGFLTVNQIALFATGKDLFELEEDLETRTVKIYDFQAGKEVAQDVQAIIPLIDQPVLIAIEEYEDVKKTKQGNEYVATGEIAIRNQIQKVYHPETRQTYVEASEEKEATQLDSWLADNKGKVRKLKSATESANTNTVTKPTSSGLFGKK